MMSRYYQPPSFEGRPFSISKFDKGKRHYWGEKGKSYGFYTSGQEIDMESVGKKHRRIKSQSANYGYEANPQQLNRRATAILERNSERREYQPAHHYRSYTQTGVQAENTVAENKEMGISSPLNIKQKLQEYVENVRAEDQNTQQKHFSQNKSFLPKISEKRVTRQAVDQYERNTGRFHQASQLEQTRIQAKNRQPVVYYHRRSRLDNPTFCNSFGYPLSCFRYV